MIKNNNFFKKNYFVDKPEDLLDDQYGKLLMVGSKNYDHFFLPFNTSVDHEELSNVRMITFNTYDSMLRYIRTLDPRQLINLSVEHDYPCLMRFA